MCHPNFVQLQSKRLLLRPVGIQDQALIHKGLGDAELTRYMLIHYPTWESSNLQMDYYRQQQLSGQGFYWVMEEKQLKAAMGVIGLSNISTKHQRAELGFWILPEFQRKGFVRESAHLIIQDAFLNHGFIRIEASAESGNIASCELLSSIGFQLEGVLRSYEWNRDKRIDLKWFGLLKSEWSEIIF